MKNARILIVEDESLVAADLEYRLSYLGYQVTGIADNGPDAIRMVHDRQVDLVLMDVRIFGGMDGIQTAAELYRQASVPVVFLTSYSDAATLDRAGATMPYGYLIKPYDETDLNATIRVAFSRWAEHERVRRIGQWITNVVLTIREPVLVANMAGRVLFLNPAAEELLGWTFNEANGLPASKLFRLLNGQTGAEIANPLSDPSSKANIGRANEDIVLLARNGAWFIVEFSVNPLHHDNGETIGSVLVLRDVTAQKVTESKLWISDPKLLESLMSKRMSPQPPRDTQ